MGVPLDLGTLRMFANPYLLLAALMQKGAWVATATAPFLFATAVASTRRALGAVAQACAPVAEAAAAEVQRRDGAAVLAGAHLGLPAVRRRRSQWGGAAGAALLLVAVLAAAQLSALARTMRPTQGVAPSGSDGGGDGRAGGGGGGFGKYFDGILGGGWGSAVGAAVGAVEDSNAMGVFDEGAEAFRRNYFLGLGRDVLEDRSDRRWSAARAAARAAAAEQSSLLDGVTAALNEGGQQQSGALAGAMAESEAVSSASRYSVGGARDSKGRSYVPRADGWSIIPSSALKEVEETVSSLLDDDVVMGDDNAVETADTAPEDQPLPAEPLPAEPLPAGQTSDQPPERLHRGRRRRGPTKSGRAPDVVLVVLEGVRYEAFDTDRMVAAAQTEARKATGDGYRSGAGGGDDDDDSIGGGGFSSIGGGGGGGGGGFVAELAQRRMLLHAPQTRAFAPHSMLSLFSVLCGASPEPYGTSEDRSTAAAAVASQFSNRSALAQSCLPRALAGRHRCA